MSTTILNWSLEVTQYPVPWTPETVDGVKRRLNLSLTDTTHDVSLSEEIRAATLQLENDLNQSFITTGWRYTTSRFPSDGSSIRIPKRPLQSVTSISYQETDGSYTVVDPSVYSVDTGRREIYLNYGQSWPGQTVTTQQAVQIDFNAGYGDELTDVPQLIKQCIALQVCKWWRDPAMEDNDTSRFDAAYERIVAKLFDQFYAGG